jgi:branched-chain amino acid transport system permease protein
MEERSLQLIIQSLVAGILLGGLYGMIALGVSLTWGMLKIINLAHFSFVFLAAYITYQITTSTGIDPFLTMFITAPLFFVIGMGLQWFFITFKIDEFASLLITFGLFIILEGVMSIIWTVDFTSISRELNPYSSTSLWIGNIALPYSRLGALIASLIIAGITQYVLNNSYAGKALRALSQDEKMATAFGINNQRLAMQLSGVSTAYAAIAGSFIAMILVLTPSGAIELIGITFAVVILGGLGNTIGAIGAGLILGVTQTLTSVLLVDPGIAPLVTFLVLIAALLFRPEGLFTRKVIL